MPASVNTITPARVEEVIVGAISDLLDHLDDVEVTRASTFKELDVDSLDVVELRQVIRSQFAVELTVDDLTGLETVGDVTDLVVERAA